MAQTKDTTINTYALGSQIKPDVDAKIYLLNPSDSPFTLLMSKLNKKPAIQPKFNWYEDELVASSGAVAAAGGTDGVGTTISVVAGQGVYFTAGDMVLVPSTGEIFKVTGVSTDDLTIVRHIGSSGGSSSIVNDAALIIIGNASAEASGLPSAKVLAKVAKTGYTQIFKTVIPWISGTAEASETLTEDEIKYQKLKYGIEHALSIERAAFFGAAYEDLGATTTRYTGGVIKGITQNVTAAGGTLTEDIWDAFIRSFLEHGSSKKVVFVSPLIASVVDKFSKGKLSTSIRDSKYGFKTMKYFNSIGEVDIVVHKKILSGTVYGGYAVGVDLEFAKIRTLRPTKLYDVVNSNNYDGKSWYYMTEVGFQVMNDKCHALLTGVTS